jgi:rRNA maturation endonuclease Nob1
LIFGALVFFGLPILEKVLGASFRAETATYRCSACGAKAKAADHFCRVCGGAVTKHEPVQYVCSSCGAKAKAADKFCSFCGAAIMAEKKKSPADTDDTI